MLSFILILTCLHSGGEPDLRDKVVTGAFAVMSAALGFVFGQRVGKR